MESGKSCCILSGLAILVVVWQISKNFWNWLYKNVIGPKIFGSNVDLARMGKWAVVTGSTDGIGKEYARELAKRGMSVVLISRSLEKLKKVAKEIGDETGVETKIIDVDFKNGPEIYEKIKKNLEGLDIGVLVNNVGISYIDYFLDVTEKDPKFLQDIININIHSVTHMTAIVLPSMVAKRKGVIINLSSTAAVVPAPLYALYSASKAFVDKFSVDLNTEYQDKGIIVQAVRPGFVSTNMTGNGKPSFDEPNARTYVQSAMQTIGIATETAGFVPHALLQASVKILAGLTSWDFTRKVCLAKIKRRVVLKKMRGEM